MLEVKNMFFKYRNNLILEDINFKINAQESVGVLGVNGAGKSTLLKCLAYILVPYQGKIMFNNQFLGNLSRDIISKHISYFNQNLRQIGFNVFESILLGRKPYYKFLPTIEDVKRVEKIISSMNLENLIDRNIADLSGGECQKVTLARIIAQEPEILLLDEPTNHLDIKNQMEIMELIMHLVKMHNMTAIISLHDINLAFKYVDKILILKDKKIFFFNNTKNITKKELKEIYDIEVDLLEVNNTKYLIPMKNLI